MDTAGAARLRCPDCAKAVGFLAGALACPGFGHGFVPAGGAWDLLLRTLDSVTVNEDRAHLEERLPARRRLFMHERHSLEWYETRWLPELVGPIAQRVPEAYGLCYASEQELAQSGLQIARLHPTVYDTRPIGLIDLVGGVLLGGCRRLTELRRRLARKHPEENAGFYVVSAPK